MSILTLILLAIILWSIYFAIEARNKSAEVHSSMQRILLIISIGLFAMIPGILSQLIEFYKAFHAIEQANDLSMGLVVAGLKASMISTV